MEITNSKASSEENIACIVSIVQQSSSDVDEIVYL